MTDSADPAACVAVILAAGSGERCGELKQFAGLGGRSVLWHALQPFIASAAVERVRVIAAAEQQAQARQAAAGAGAKVEVLAAGGETRAASAHNGLAGLPDETWALVHDAARPCLSAAALARLLAYTRTGGGDAAALALPVSDALRTARGGRLQQALPRADVWAMQTPQLCRAGRLRQALARAPDAADEAEAIMRDGGSVDVIPGERANIKITYAEDLQLAARILGIGAASAAARAGA